MNSRLNEIHVMNGGYSLKIIDYMDCNNCTIQFDNGLILKDIRYGDIIRGEVKNRTFPSVYGVGYLGIGKYSCSENGTRTKCYSIWTKILKRSYDEDVQNIEPTYKGCSVDERWHNFQNFAEWWEENFKSHMQDWQIDKDILVKGNKVYSPETCAFVPHEINSLLTNKSNHRGEYPIGVQLNQSGTFSSRCRVNSKTTYLGRFNTPEEAFQAYKTAKEQYIKEVADKWKDQITKQTYNALINYKVEIDD